MAALAALGRGYTAESITPPPNLFCQELARSNVFVCGGPLEPPRVSSALPEAESDAALARFRDETSLVLPWGGGGGGATVFVFFFAFFVFAFFWVTLELLLLLLP